MTTVREWRHMTENITISLENELEFYSILVDALIDWSLEIVTGPNLFDQWPQVMSTIALLRAGDSLGIQRALGAAFFGCWNGVFHDDITNDNKMAMADLFIENEGSANALLRTVQNFLPDIWREQYVDVYCGSELEYNLTTMTRQIIDGGMTWNTQECSLTSLALNVSQRNDLANQWQAS